MKRIALALLLSLTALVALPAPAAHAGEYAEWVGTRDMHAHAMSLRANRGLPTQALDEDCCRVAQRWAEWMAQHRTMRHGGGENIIAYGTSRISTTFQMWLNSPGHRAFVLGRHKKAGYGCARSSNGTWYWAGAFRN